MIDWTKSMQHTFEFYVVDPATWRDKTQLKTVTSCSIDWDSTVETLGSSSIDLTELPGECYIRTYLIANQNGVTEKRPLGTFLYQAPSFSFNGKITSNTMDGYTPLIELKEKLLPMGYFVSKYEDVNKAAYYLAHENARAPVIPSEYSYTWRVDSTNASSYLDNKDLDIGKPTNNTLPAKEWGTASAKMKHINDLLYIVSDDTTKQDKYYKYVYEDGSYKWKPIDSLESTNDMTDKSTPRLRGYFVADPEDHVLKFTADLLANDKKRFALDEMGNILFTTNKDIESMRPTWTYTDDNSSILYSDIQVSRDLYGIPNVVEAIYSSNTEIHHCRIVNDDPNSPTSTVSRGREIVYRTTDPGFTTAVYGKQADKMLEEFAKETLKSLSTLEYSVSYKHAYCPVKVGDCVLINYTKAGLNNVKAKVISQSIDCRPGCPVTETAIFTSKLWR